MNIERDKNCQITNFVMQSMLKNTTDMIFIKDTQLVYNAASQSFAKLVGIKDPEEIIGKTDGELFHDEELVKRYIADDHNLLKSGMPLKAYIEPIWADDGSRGYCQTSKFPIFDETGNVIGLYGISRDITLEYKAKLNYEQELRALFELPSDAIGAVLTDVTNWRVIDTRINSDKYYKVVRLHSVEELIKETANAIVEDEEVREVYHSFSQRFFQSLFETGRRQLSLEYKRLMLDGNVKWVQNDLHFISDPVNGNLCVMSILRNIDKQKREEQALTLAAQRDALTKIYNRETTMMKINQFITGEGKTGNHLLFMIDVDNFKLVNDTFGHRVGDDTLVHIANTIKNVFSERDIVGRVGGDEFFALMKNSYDLKEVKNKAIELVEALQTECAEGKLRVELSCSIGISHYTGDEKTLEQLYAEADAALYKAKKMGKNQFIFADTKLEEWKEKETLNAVNLRTLLENMDADMFQTELDNNNEVQVTYSSHSLFSNTNKNKTKSGVRGENIWDVILPMDLELLKKSIRDATIDKSVLDCSCRVTNSLGQIEWRHVCGTQMPDQGDGINSRMIHIATDITKQKQIEVELREKNSIIDFAMRNTDVNMWYYDFETEKCQLTKSCQQAHNMVGVEELENFPECLIDMGYVREDCIELLCSTYEYVRKNGASKEFDIWFKKADGTGWWCERNMLSPLPSADGRVTRGIGIGKNVTAEKLLEEKYEAFGAYRKLAEKNTRLSVRMNLTTGWIDECLSSIPAVKELYPVNKLENFLQCMRNRFVIEEELEEFNKNFSSTNLLEAFFGGESFKNMECHYRNENEHVIWLRITVEMMKNPVNGNIEALLYSSDVDHEKNMSYLVDKLLEDDYEFLGLIDVSTGRLMVFGENIDNIDMAQNGTIYEKEMQRIFKGLILEEYYEEGVRTMSLSHVIGELKTKNYYTCSFPARTFAHTQAGRKQWKFGYLDDSHSKILMSRTDITSMYTAEYDSLTGLYNREAFYHHVKELLNENTDKNFLLIRFDIDRFKAYNDVYGNQAGDRLLAAAGKSARHDVWPEKSVFGHLEADHFAFVIPQEEFSIEDWNIKHIEWLEKVTEGYHLTSSVGIYKIIDFSLEVSLMCDRALLALRTVKDSYTRKIAWYCESLRDKLMREQMLVDDMEQALLLEQFVLYFQPLVNYDNGSIIGAEALVRWVHPTRGLIPPGEFIPLFEKNGFILKLDAFVWEKSCEYLRHWLEIGKNVVPISVNVSRCDLYDPDLCEKFKMLLKKYNLPFSMLKLEITESAYMEDPEQLIGIVSQLRSSGFIVEMDDFGTGYSSLNMLKDVPVDILKLDTRFISESESDARAVTILSSVIRMAQRLGLSIIVEGVETKAQADSLKELKCSNMQGYYFSRPLQIDKFEQML